ncbi:MAG: FkbM family methyltransferase [Bacteroidia bacterium]|nr:class I SAM-dependent methyltransferase [Bacteroidia bacterium]MDW8158551.1 FkbM family methyltransferase [Bacteroidia bacterium]
MKKVKKIVWEILRFLGLSGYVAIVTNSYLKEMGWFTSHAKQKSIDSEGNPLPWMPYSFIYFLEPRLRPHFSIFEYGSGNSTLWLAKRVKEVIAVEHNPTWLQEIKNKLPTNTRIIFKQDPKEYVNAIQETNRKFDIIIVDGINRNECIISAPEYLNAGGVIIVDNLERAEYWSAIYFLLEKGYKIIEFKGIPPAVSTSTITGVLYRKDNCLEI